MLGVNIMVDLVGFVTIVLEVLAFVFATLIAVRLLKVYWNTLDDSLCFLGIGFVMVSIASLVFSVIPLVQLQILLLYLYLVAILMDAFGYIMMVLSYLYNKITKNVYQIIPFVFSAHLISLVALAILSYYTLHRKSFLVGIGFTILLIHHIVDLNGLLQMSPELLIISEMLRPLGLLLLLNGLRK
jgi:hypothetical protein